MRGLYIHIPFCVKKCKYCDFNSFMFSSEDKKTYLTALFKNMEMYKGEEIDTVFIGGGTPTSLDSSELAMLIDKIRLNFKLAENCEFTVYMNPKTVDCEKLTIMKKKGVTRLSIGVQTFCDEELYNIGRIHSVSDAIETIELVKECGFENFSIDLMSALPGQNLESLKKSLEVAIDMSPAHISCYSLILEEGTPLYEEYIRGELNLPDEDEERLMYDTAVKMLEDAGYKRYEISNFAKDGFCSKHNIKYWKCSEYIGIGISAHSYVNGKRFSMTDDFDKYIEGNFSKCNEEVLSKDDMMSEFAFLGLRMDEGISSKEFYERFGVNFEDVFKAPINKFSEIGVICKNGDNWRISPEAVGISNSIMCVFIL